MAKHQYRIAGRGMGGWAVPYGGWNGVWQLERSACAGNGSASGTKCIWVQTRTNPCTRILYVIRFVRLHANC